jgi:hypothetical protein
MKGTHLLPTVFVLFAFPLTASAQRGAVRAPHASGGQNQNQMQQQMIRQQQQAIKQQQQMEKSQQRAMQKQVASQQKALAAQQKNASKSQQNGAKPHTNATKQSIRKGSNTGHAQSDAMVTKNGAPKKPTTAAKKDLTAKERRERDVEERRVARVKRWQSFERWLRDSGFWNTYEGRFLAANNYAGMEEWLAKQESLRAQGLAVDPLFTHYRSFFAKYKP